MSKQEEEPFEEFIERVIRPLVESYKPLNSQEKWYLQWYLVPMEVIDPDSYILKLLNLRKDPTLTVEFKAFLFRLASIVHFDYVRKHG